MSKAYTFRLDPDLIAEVDRVRGDVNRTRFVQRALEKALTVCSCGATGVGDERARRHGPECMYWTRALESALSGQPKGDKHTGHPVAPSAPTRAPVEKEPHQPFRCPVAGCDFHARSSQAKCSVHGRTVR